MKRLKYTASKFKFNFRSILFVILVALIALAGSASVSYAKPMFSETCKSVCSETLPSVFSWLGSLVGGSNCQTKCEKLGCVWENDRCVSTPSICIIGQNPEDETSKNAGQQTFECVYGSVQKPDVTEKIINDKQRQKITPTAVVVHFTGRSSLEESLQSLVDHDLVVQFMVDKDGTIYQLMHDIETLSSGARCANKNSINIEIVGTNEQELLSNEVQFQSVSGLVKWLSQEYDIDLQEQKASSPQSGILGHSEVDIECPSGTGKFDPGHLYMAKLRTNLCKRSMLFDLTVDASKPPTRAYLQQNKLALEKLNQVKNNAIHIILAGNTPDKNYIDIITGDSIAPDCTIVMNKRASAISLSAFPLSCTLTNAEISDAEGNLQVVAQEKLSDAVFTVASDISDKIDSVNQYESSIADASNFVFEENAGAALNPTACAVCSEEAGSEQPYAQQAISSASGLSTADINSAYETAKSEYMARTDTFLTAEMRSIDFSRIKEDPSAHVTSTTGDRIKTWAYYVFPRIFPEKIESIGYSRNGENYRNDAHFYGETYYAPVIIGWWNCRIRVESGGEVTKDEKIGCSSSDYHAYPISIGENGDCRATGVAACKIIFSEGYIFKNYEIYIISVYSSMKVETPIIDTGVNAKVEKVVNALRHGVITASSNKYGVKVSPEEVYTIAVGEGLNQLLFMFYTMQYTDDLSVSGFDALGTDVIGTEIGALKGGGFVSRDLKITTQQFYNEKGEAVTSGIFDNINDAFEGVAGTIAYRKYLFFRDLQSIGVDPSSISRKQANFWLYMYYNPGPGAAKKQLRKFVHDGILDDASYINVKPNEQITNGRIARNNAIIRAVVIETMYELGVLNLPGYSTVI